VALHGDLEKREAVEPGRVPPRQRGGWGELRRPEG